MKTEAQKRATKKYDDLYSKQVALKLNTKTDADIFCRLDEVGNKQGYIKKLIRDDIKRIKEEKSVNIESDGDSEWKYIS